MTTKLNKPVSRRIGDLVVTMTAGGIRVRRHGRRKTSTLPMKVLRGMLDAENVRSRADAFALPSPPGWCPRPGEQVFISAGVSPGDARGRVVSVRDGFPSLCIRMVLGWHRELYATLGDVRPLPAALARPEPERPLFSGLNERNVSDA